MSLSCTEFSKYRHNHPGERHQVLPVPFCYLLPSSTKFGLYFNINIVWHVSIVIWHNYAAYAVDPEFLGRVHYGHAPPKCCNLNHWLTMNYCCPNIWHSNKLNLNFYIDINIVAHSILLFCRFPHLAVKWAQHFSKLLHTGQTLTEVFVWTTHYSCYYITSVSYEVNDIDL